MGMSPFRAANRSGVKPLTVDARASAPASSSTRTMSACPSATAHISAVLPVSDVALLTRAPPPMRRRTTCALPVRAAVIRGVRPLVWLAFASAPAASSASVMAGLAFSAARCSGRHAVVVRRVDAGPGPGAAGRPSSDRPSAPPRGSPSPRPRGARRRRPLRRATRAPPARPAPRRRRPTGDPERRPWRRPRPGREAGSPHRTRRREALLCIFLSSGCDVVPRTPRLGASPDGTEATVGRPRRGGINGSR